MLIENKFSIKDFFWVDLIQLGKEKIEVIAKNLSSQISISVNTEWELMLLTYLNKGWKFSKVLITR